MSEISIGFPKFIHTFTANQAFQVMTGGNRHDTDLAILAIKVLHPDIVYGHLET